MPWLLRQPFLLRLIEQVGSNALFITPTTPSTAKRSVWQQSSVFVSERINVNGTCVYTLSGRTGSALVSHTRGRVFERRLLQQVLRFVGRVYTGVPYVELRGYCHEDRGCDQSIGSTVSDAILHCGLWLTETRSSSLCNFSILPQVVDN